MGRSDKLSGMNASQFGRLLNACLCGLVLLFVVCSSRISLSTSDKNYSLRLWLESPKFPSDSSVERESNETKEGRTIIKQFIFI